MVPAVRRAYSFFSSASCKTLTPSIASAYIFLSSAFSFSSFLSRLASATSIIPYFLRHRCRVATDICFCWQKLSWLRSLASHSRSSRMISSGLCLFCLFMLVGFGCYQILSLNMDHFFWRRPIPFIFVPLHDLNLVG